MSAAALELLAAFDALPGDDRDAAVEAILVRHPAWAGGLPHDGLVEAADEVFLLLDAAEAADGPAAG